MRALKDMVITFNGIAHRTCSRRFGVTAMNMTPRRQDPMKELQIEGKTERLRRGDRLKTVPVNLVHFARETAGNVGSEIRLKCQTTNGRGKVFGDGLVIDRKLTPGIRKTGVGVVEIGE